MRRIPPGLAPVLFIPGLVYETLVRARNGLYAAALLPQKSLSAPVISVGNITMGGTGKTPLVIHAARTLAALGFHPAVLSRGYGRIEPRKCRVVAPGDRIESPAKVLGDEPALIRRHVPSAFLGVSPDRFLAGSLVAERVPRPTFLLDDGFQHRRLLRNLDIVLVDSSQGLADNRVFPRGTLREPLAGLRRCQVVIIQDARNGKGVERCVEEVRRYQPAAAVFRCRQTISSLVPFRDWVEGAAPRMQRPGPAYLVAALGNPGRFERDVRDLGIEIRGARFFRDHHWIKPRDWAECVEEARRKGAGAIVLTEKDAVKISNPPGFPLLVATQSTELSDAKEFELVLKKCAEERA